MYQSSPLNLELTEAKQQSKKAGINNRGKRSQNKILHCINRTDLTTFDPLVASLLRPSVPLSSSFCSSVFFCRFISSHSLRAITPSAIHSLSTAVLSFPPARPSVLPPLVESATSPQRSHLLELRPPEALFPSLPAAPSSALGTVHRPSLLPTITTKHQHHLPSLPFRIGPCFGLLLPSIHSSILTSFLSTSTSPSTSSSNPPSSNSSPLEPISRCPRMPLSLGFSSFAASLV
jgi:hypothetical protein